MAVLMALVIVALIMAGVWVGYNAWEHSLTEEYDTKAHTEAPATEPAELYRSYKLHHQPT